MFRNDDGEYSGYCFACSTYVPNPYNDKPVDYKPPVLVKSQAEIDEELLEIGTYRSRALPDRSLREETLRFFQVKVGVSETDGVSPVTHYYPYRQQDKLVGYKVRLIENKSFWAVGTTKDVDLFGWKEAIGTGAKRLFICEGEVDAMSLYQIFKDHNKGTQYADFNPAVVSLPSGAGSAVRSISRQINEIRQYFKEIVIVFDTDVAGKQASDAVSRSLPDVLVASLPEKDVNECLKQGRSKACYNACQFNASLPKNTRFISGDDLHEKAKEPPIYGVSWPWEHITRATRGIRLGETIYIGAG